ncbi:hypothetical protein EYU68_20825 [Escherichia coli]|nr:hypothetical protein [Escherichia coli]EFA5437283.1 hypothetical protein [Escherichia coli]
MSSHDRLRIGLAKTCQNWRAFAHVMQVHENHYIKRAGVAGIRARACGFEYSNHVMLIVQAQMLF